MNKPKFLVYVYLIILPNLIFLQNIYKIVENNNIILSDFTTSNDKLLKTITNDQFVYECGYGFWFRYSLNYPKIILTELPNGTADLGGIYYSDSSTVF